MSWKKYFNTASVENNATGSYSALGGSGRQAGPASSNYNSYLPDVYIGSPNRIERYGHYNTMDLDSEVNAALDILAEFCSQSNRQNGTAFRLDFVKSATNTEVQILSEYLKQWSKLNKFETRIFRILRNVFKYGDQIFIRDPETKKLFHIEPSKLKRIIVNESEGKVPEQYIIDDINFNFKNLIATTPHETNSNILGGGSGYLQGGVRGMVGGSYASQAGSRFQIEERETAVDAKHVLHLSLSEGLDANYPFGNSLLETVFKVYKQKELLEDAIIIYRVQRAPERRVFYVDVGGMPPHLAMQFVERVKTEIHQRRIPSATGGGQNVIDSAYNPLSVHEDYFFPQSCLSLDTKIKLLDNRSLTLAEIISEYTEGKTNYTYTVNQKTHELETGKIAWAGVTRKNTQVVLVTMDNGESVTCTPDHRFIMHNGSEVEAQDLEKNSQVMSLESPNTEHSFNEYQANSTRVRCVEWLEETVDTGDITVESPSNSHNFALSVGIFVHNSEGRGSKVETLPGGSNLGEIDDLKYFTNKLVRGLRIPSSYLPTGAEDGASSYNDGRVGTAYIQELRFNTYCERLQGLVIEGLNEEFKRYLLESGVNIDTNMFNLKFEPPQNFASYRQSELDNSRVPTYGQMSAIPYISSRFALKRFLGLSDEEIAENERLWREENDDGVEVAPSDAEAELRSMGISSSGIESDLGGMEDEFTDDLGDIDIEDTGADDAALDTDTGDDDDTAI